METESSRPVSDEEENMQLFDDDNDNEEPGNPMDEAVEVPVPNEGILQLSLYCTLLFLYYYTF